MKVSSLSGSPMNSGIYLDQQSKQFLPATKRKIASVLKAINHIGTSIALGESGNLDAAHAFRTKEAGKRK